MNKRLKNAKIAPKTFTYKPVAKTEEEKNLQESYPQLFKEFEAISIGDDGNGTICLIPLDECDRKTANKIVELLNNA